MKSVFVCGSGPSGTSMLAGLFAERGYCQGDDLYPPRDANPKGFFENQQEINLLNERIMLPSVESGYGRLAADLLRTFYREGQYWLALLPAGLRSTSKVEDDKRGLHDLDVPSPVLLQAPTILLHVGFVA